MISFEKFEKDILYLEDLDEKIDEIIKFIGVENKIVDLLFDCHNKIVDNIMEGFGDVEFINDYISWWIFDCNYGTENTEIYNAETDDKIDNLKSAKRLYNYLIRINKE